MAGPVDISSPESLLVALRVKLHRAATDADDAAVVLSRAQGEQFRTWEIGASMRRHHFPTDQLAIVDALRDPEFKSAAAARLYQAARDMAHAAAQDAVAMATLHVELQGQAAGSFYNSGRAEGSMPSDTPGRGAAGMVPAMYGGRQVRTSPIFLDMHDEVGRRGWILTVDGVDHHVLADGNVPTAVDAAIRKLRQLGLMDPLGPDMRPDGLVFQQPAFNGRCYAVKESQIPR